MTSPYGLDLFGDSAAPPPANTMSKKTGLPAAPFSVLDARSGEWQERKRAWLSLGLKSELGRGENLLKMSDTVLEPDPVKRAAMQAARKAKADAGEGLTFGNEHLDEKAQRSLGVYQSFGGAAALERAGGGSTGTSIFDPVLVEFLVKGFSPEGGMVFDPFAGGSVRGVVTTWCNREYTGIDLRKEQIEANVEQGDVVCKGRHKPRWICGDSVDSEKLAPGLRADMILSCPPYADLEVYSDDPRDISTMEYPAFVAAYRKIIAAAVRMLKPDRFAAFVVGDVRDEKGLYRCFDLDTVLAFRDAGAPLYNRAPLVTPTGTLPLRAGKAFEVSRKLGKAHQDVLVFVKGDPRKAADHIRACEGVLK